MSQLADIALRAARTPKESAAALRELGFCRPSRAAKDLLALSPLYPAELLAELLLASTQSADPDASLSSAERVLTERRDLDARPAQGAALPMLALLGGASDFLPRVLAARPRLLDLLARSRYLDREKSADLFFRELKSRADRASDLDGLSRALRRYKYREVARLALRELSGRGDLPAVARELSSLASAAFGVAAERIDRKLREQYGVPEGEPLAGRGFAVIGMGKLGGNELNFASDVDVIYVYRGDGGTSGGDAGSISNREYYARLAEQLTRTVGEVTADGFVFRVDLNLRPEGRNGPIVSSQRALEDYYETFGRTWERAALLKARPVAGDLALGQATLDALAPFVYRKYLDLSAVEEIRAIKAEIDRRAKGDPSDVKLGSGGIREVEFFVQALQLLYAGREQGLRVRGTLPALDRLVVAGILNGRERDELSEAYVFMRRVEHRLQMVAERQTQKLPDKPEALKRLARALGLEDAPALERELERHRAVARRAFGDLLRTSTGAPPPEDPVLLEALDLDAPNERRQAALFEKGFSDPEAALAALARLTRPAGSPFAARPRPEEVAVRLLADAVAAPDPDRALFHLAEMLCSLSSPRGTYRLLAENPRTARLLATLFGTSDYLTKYFLRHPELIDVLVRSDSAISAKGVTRLRCELRDRLAGREDPEEVLPTLNRFKNEEVLRIGLHDVGGSLGLVDVGEELSALAEVLLGAALDLAEWEARARFGVPGTATGEPATLAVVGLGKLGGREMGYHSDLDLLFVYSAAGESSGGARGRVSNHEYFARLAQRLLSFLQMPLREGTLYRADTRLRPSGNQGTLVVSLESFVRHHQERAQLWERQALLKARFLGGDPDLYGRTEREALIPAVDLRDPDPPAVAAEIHRLRLRMERELAGESSDQYHPKLGRGGLADVEFVVQYLQLIHGHAHPDIRDPSTPRAIGRLLAAHFLSPEQAETLSEAYLFLRRLENRLRIVHGFHMAHMPRVGPGLLSLARRLGYVGPDAASRLLADYESCTRRVRNMYETFLVAEA